MKLKQFLEENEDFKLKKTGEKKATQAHPEGKPIYNIVNREGIVIGTIEPYHATSGKKRKGSRLLHNVKNVTHYSIHFDTKYGPPSHEVDRHDRDLFRGHSTPKAALEAATTIIQRYGK